MNESKIQLRAQILQEISKLRSIPAVVDKDIEDCIANLSQIRDKVFLCTLLLKEIDGSIVYFDGILGILAMHLANASVLEKCVFVLLEKPNVKDEKKLFLINLLTQAGVAVDPNLIHLYVKNADEIIDLETEKFLKLAEVNPEAQIDFLDFYYGIQKQDADILLNSMIKDYSGDLLANILSPLIYTLQDPLSIELCIDGLLKSRSYLAYAPLEWLVQTSGDQKIVSLARKTMKELKIAGLRDEISTLEYYKDLFKTSKPLGAYVSSIDGASNFSFVFAREYENGTISTFFTVFNLEFGPISCFGLSNISRNEYENVLHRFFKDTEKIPLEPAFAHALANELANLGMAKHADIPYEFFCWRQLMYDIEPLGEPVLGFMKKELGAFCGTISEISKADIQRALNSEYGARWFFPTSREKYPEFCKLMDEILALNEDEFEKLDEITAAFLEASKTGPILKDLKNRFLYEAYFLKCLDFKNLSSLFYSIYSGVKISDIGAKTASVGENSTPAGENSFLKFAEFAIKRSIYEFFLSYDEAKNAAQEAIKGASDKKNIFLRKRAREHFDFNSKKMLKLIETKWTLGQ